MKLQTGLLTLVGLNCGLMISTALATVGGPTIIDVLGWDPENNRVYFTETAHDEGNWVPSVYYVPLGETSDHRPVCVDEELRTPEEEDETKARVEELKKGLRPLQGSFGDTTEVLLRVVRQDSLERPMNPPQPRFVYDVFIRQDDFVSSSQVIVYCRPGGRVVNWLATPDPDVRLAVFSFVGNPMEICYEMQKVVVLERRR